MRYLQVVCGAVVAALVFGSALAEAKPVPRPTHVVIIIEENKTHVQVIGDDDAPWMNSVAKTGAIFTKSFGVTHPSQPNYLALFSGLVNTNGDGCPAAPIDAKASNLASELIAAHFTFEAYSENLPYAGYTGCSAGLLYARKHEPWVAFANVPPSLHKPYGQLPSFARLATLTFLIPNLIDDMHDAPVHVGDIWAQHHLAGLIDWARTNDTLVIFTWDEGYDNANSIPTFFIGPMVRTGRYSERIDHYRVLRTLEDMYGLRPTGRAASAKPITDVWK